MPVARREPPIPDAAHFERIKASWDRFRAWDHTHAFWSDSTIAALVVLGSFLVPPRLGLDGPGDILLQLALGLPLIWRRRAPSLVFISIALVALLQWLASVPLTGDVALLIALFTLAVYDTPRRALIGAGVLQVGVVMASVRWAPAGDVVKSVIFLSGMVVAALFVGLTLRTWRASLDSLVERANRLECERDQQARLAVAAERARIAREMHDVVAHNVSIMVTLAEGARAVARTDPGTANETMAEVSATGRMALTDMRHLLGVLRTEEHEADRSPQPELFDIPRLIDGVRATGLDVELRELGHRFPIPPGSGLAIFRIVQESLTNILKHATGPSRAAVAVVFDAPFVELTIRDDGEATASRPEGHGLCGMRERASICGGWLKAGPHPEGGWEVSSRIRIDGSAASR